MEDDLLKAKPFAVVEFYDGFQIIRSEWGNFDENYKMVSSYFPPNVDGKEFFQFLKNDGNVDKATWCDDEGKPWELVKFCCFASSIDEANSKIEFFLKLSEVESDEAANIEKLKKSRHSRNVSHKKREERCESKEREERCESKEREKRCESKERTSTNSCKRPPSRTMESYESEDIGESHDNDEPGAKKLKTIASQKRVNSSSKISNTRNSGDDFEMETIQIDEIPVATKSSDHTDSLNDDKKLTLILKKLTKVEMVVTNGNQSSSSEKRSTHSFLTPDEDLQLFPAKSKAEIVHIEEKLKNEPRFLSKVVAALIDLGQSNNDSTTLINMMNHVVTFKAGQEFSFQGRSGKKTAFKPLKLFAVVYHSMKKIARNEINQKKVGEFVSNWLDQCKNRAKRQEEKLQKQRLAQQEAVLNFPEEDDE